MVANIIPKVSIVIPVYNAEKDLARCLDSVQNQTYQKLEVLLIDDGSSDNSEEICRSYVNKNPLFCYYKQENSGASVARNKGVELSNGSWICFIDADDYVESDMVECLVNEISMNTDVICCGCVAEVGNQSVKNPFFDHNMVFRENKRELFLQLLNNNYHAKKYRYTAIGVPWGKLYRKSFLDYQKITFDRQLRCMEDNIFNMDVFMHAREVKYINYLGYHYAVEHVKKYADIYDKNAAEYLSKIVQGQKDRMEAVNLLDDEEILRNLVWEAAKIYILAIQKSYYVCPDMNYREKCKKAQILLQKEPFRSLFMKMRHMRKLVLLKLIIHTNLLFMIIEGKRIWKKL